MTLEPGEPLRSSGTRLRCPAPLARRVGYRSVRCQDASAGDAPRFHVDIETDVVDAETARLVELGAVEQSRWLDCRTLRVPGGQWICVIPLHSEPDEFARGAHGWRSGADPG